MPGLMTILTNKYTWIALVVIAIVAYYNVRIVGMEVTYNLQVAKYNKLHEEHNTLDNKYQKLKVDVRELMKTNKENVAVVLQYKADLDKMKEVSIIQNGAKDEEIASLLETIKNLRELPSPDYNQSIIVKDCEVFISEGETDYEKQKLKDLSTIGQ